MKMKKIMKRIEAALSKKTSNKEFTLVWNGSQVDLMEIIYALYMSKMLENGNNRKATLGEITEFVFKMFNREPPDNPSRPIVTMRMRADPKIVSLLYKTLCYLYPGYFMSGNK